MLKTTTMLLIMVGGLVALGIHPAAGQVGEPDRAAGAPEAGLFPVYASAVPAYDPPTSRGDAGAPDVPAALQERERFPQGVALVAAGTALIITGSLINDSVGRAIVVGGAGVVGLGVYRLLR